MTEQWLWIRKKTGVQIQVTTRTQIKTDLATMNVEKEVRKRTNTLATIIWM
jgi:hypothetical protein